MDVVAPTGMAIFEGLLESVVAFGPGGLDWVDGLLFTIDGRPISIVVDTDTDSIDLHDRDVFPAYDQQERKRLDAFARYEGRVIGFAWTMTNNFGYRDGVQFSVGPDGGYATFQLIAEGSRFVLHALSEQVLLKRLAN